MTTKAENGARVWKRGARENGDILCLCFGGTPRGTQFFFFLIVFRTLVSREIDWVFDLFCFCFFVRAIWGQLSIRLAECSLETAVAKVHWSRRNVNVEGSGLVCTMRELQRKETC